jgi:hypothetical protein
MSFSKSQVAYTILRSIFDCAPKHNRPSYINSVIRDMGLDIISNCNRSLMTIVYKRKQHKNIGLSTDANMLIGTIFNVTNEKLTLISKMPSPPSTITKSIFSRESKTEGCEIYETNDGTTIGLYWFNEQWIIRSINGFDVRNYTWNSNKTYQTVFDEVMAEYPEFSLDALDKNKCYTIGLKHPDFHPFSEGSESPVIKAWLIDSVDTVYITEHNGIVPECDKPERIGIPLQIPETEVDIDRILKKMDTAINDFIDSGKVFYGVMLKVPNGCMMVQSSLYKYISNLFYTGNDNMDIKTSGYDRQHFILLKMFLGSSPESLYRFLQLFPQFKETVERYNTIVEEISDLMMNPEIKLNHKPNTQRDVLLINTFNALKTQYFKYTGSNTIKLLPRSSIVDICIKSLCKLSTLYDLMNYVEPPAVSEDLTISSPSLS